MTPLSPIAVAILPARYEQRDGQLVEVAPAQACPELLTPDEAARYLRLDVAGVKDVVSTLDRYRAMGLLRGTQVSRRVLYRRVELEKFLDRLTSENPR